MRYEKERKKIRERMKRNKEIQKTPEKFWGNEKGEKKKKQKKNKRRRI